ncbi:MAG TPA: hypothetical protein VHG28_20125 [Longimicrobiaceae bacterium]|nr:hypothetical protein [Longimicrobiaceae bacterium]
MPNRRLYTGTEVQTLDAGWWNYDGTATIYLTSDPSLNQASLTLANHTSGPIAIAAGSPAEYGTAPEDSGALYLYFNGLLTNEQVQAIHVDAEGWTAAAFTDDVTGLAYLALAPAAAVTLQVSETLTFSLSDVTATGSARAGNLTLVMAGLTGAPLGAGTQSVFVNVAAAPQQGNRKLELLVGFAGQDFVFTGGTDNELLLVLTNPGPEPLVPDGVAAWGVDPPTFAFSFVFTPAGTTAPGALTDAGNTSDLDVVLAGSYGNYWDRVEPNRDGDYPIWTAQPSNPSGGTVLGVGTNASVSFRIVGLRSYQPAGATYLYLSYANVPGYDDGYFAVEIVKVAPVVATLSANPNSITDATGQTPVQLTYSVENATYATITNTTLSLPVPGSASGTLGVSVASTTVFTLLASNHFTGQTVAASETVGVSPDVFGVVPRGTIVMWSGSASDVPTGWSLCDGSPGTPDLVNRFILGAGTEQTDPAVNDQGGSSSHSHNASADVTVLSAGAHNHGVPSHWYANKAGSGGSVTVVDRDARSVSHAKTQTAGNHTHQTSTAVHVNSASSLPPYYALAFIIKMS